MNKVIIFGIQDFAELAHYYLTNDSSYTVVAFSVNEDYMPSVPNFKGLPIIPFESIELNFPPSDYLFFAPMSPIKMNTVREEIYNNIKSKGYQLINYISSRATIFDNPIGENCFILENTTIQPYCSIGNNVIIWSGCNIAHHSIINNHIMLTPSVIISGHCTINNYCTLGINSKVRNGLILAEGTFLAMGANLVVNTEPWSVYMGNPAHKSNLACLEI